MNITCSSHTEINTDKAVKIRIKAINYNSLVLHFKFFNEQKQAINITFNKYNLSIVDPVSKAVLIEIANANWTRPTVNELKYIIPSLNLVKGTYLVDFTCTYHDGIIQTLADGDLIVRDKYAN